MRSGVVVVTTAGNSGYAGDVYTLGPDYHTVSISDPGNTESVLTVGSTHRADPHRHGVSHFSSRGPTGLLSHNALIAFDADHKFPIQILLNYSSLIEKNHHQSTGREPEYSITRRSQIT